MRVWTWAGWAALAVAGAALAFVAWVYAASEAHYRSFPPPPAFSHPIPTDAASIALGAHLARTRGCGGCHGAELQGEIMWGSVETPNLPALARDVSPAAMEAALRHGVGHDGRALYSMPSFNFVHMSDADVAALIAYLQTAPISETPVAGERGPWLDAFVGDFTRRLEIARGNDGAMPHWLHHVPELTQQNNPDPAIALGEYLAMTSCNECHGFDLRGFQPWGGPPGAPDLIAMSAYSEADFARLMREGVPSSGADLPMMGPVARGRFAHWTDEEVHALYAYLSDMSQRAVEAEQ